MYVDTKPQIAATNLEAHNFCGRTLYCIKPRPIEHLWDELEC